MFNHLAGRLVFVQEVQCRSQGARFLLVDRERNMELEQAIADAASNVDLIIGAWTRGAP